jgi:hypothetical protein
MEGVLNKRPTFYRGGVPDDFKDLQDLKEMERFLESIEVIVNFLEKALNVSPRSFKEMDLSGCYPETWREITLSTIFLTASANRILTGTFKFEAIEKARLKDLFAHLFEKEDQGKGVISMELRNGLEEWLSLMENDPQRREHLVAFQDFCLDLLEETLGKVPPGEEIDPRFVKGLLIYQPFDK